MAKPRQHSPVVRFAAMFSRHGDALNWATEMATSQWGNVLVQTADMPFTSTSYYKSTMGSDLLKRLVAFEELIDATELVESKLLSNQWETDFVETSPDSFDEERPLNIDPGYLTEAKVVLATMKDRDHRLYLGKQVFGEVTLFYQLPGVWKGSRWTYPDYLLPDYHDFFSKCRAYLRERLQQFPGT